MKEVNLSVQDGEYSYPAGLVDFCFSSPDTNNEVVLTFVTDLKPSQVAVRKYNPNSKTYGDVTEATVTETTHQGEPALQVTYNIVDNGPLDTNSTIGEIADPVGLAVLGVTAPDTGFKPNQSVTQAAIISTLAIVTLAASSTPVRQTVVSRLSSKK